jgi:hypothetical protein
VSPNTVQELNYDDYLPYNNGDCGHVMDRCQALEAWHTTFLEFLTPPSEHLLGSCICCARPGSFGSSVDSKSTFNRLSSWFAPIDCAALKINEEISYICVRIQLRADISLQRIFTKVYDRKILKVYIGS